MPVTYKDTVEVVVLDIEGTVCPISFVKDTLFPYFLDKIPSELSQLQFPLIPETDSPIGKICSQFPEENNNTLDKLLNHIKLLVKNDIKDPVLKSLQGLIWKLGYENGELLAPLYDDAIDFIQKSPREYRKTYIYSSGSVKAQILLFGHVKGDNGSTEDLNQYLSGYYDITTSGHKQERNSYENILQDIGYSNKPGNVLFFSDNVKEVQAALKAGMKSVVVVKPGNASLTEQDHREFDIIESFAEVEI